MQCGLVFIKVDYSNDFFVCLLHSDQSKITLFLLSQKIRYPEQIITFRYENQIAMNRIKEILTERGLKQTWLAENLGKSYNMVNSYVQNRQQPRLEVLYKIAELLQVSPKDLLIEPDNNNSHK